MRVKNREKARVHIGDRVPVISSTIVGTNAAGTAPITTEQIQYIDVGIKIEAEPTIHPDDTVAVKINLDVSSLGTQTKTNAGTTAYEVGTRNAATSLRLKDGETQALMGLIRDDDVQTGGGLPFVGEAPLLDRIFGNKRTERRSRELVLLITPRLVRGIRAPDAVESEFWSGTEAALRLRSPFVQTVADAAAGPAAAAASPAAATLVAAAAAALPPPAPLALAWALPAKLAAGAESRIELRAKTEGALKGASVQLRYDPEQLEVLAVEEGSFFGQGGRKTVFTPRIDAAFGIVTATFGAVDAPVRGDAPLLTLRVKPRGAGGKARLAMASLMGIDDASRRVPASGAETLELVFVP
jgi:general secretion pathway protein D